MVRAVIGLVAAALLWTVAFLALTFAIAAVWPAYAAHGRTWFESGVFTFEPPMAALNVLCWVVAEALAGWVAVAIGRRRWAIFPWWYNVAVVALAAPAVLLGGKMAAGLLRRAAPAVAA